MAKNSSSNPVRLGIIGSGLAVKWLHWPALQKMAGKYKIVMTCDVDPNAAQEVARMAAELDSPECRWTTDYRELLANEEIEAVLLSLPIHLNAQIMLEAALAGKHIIAEKPLAANLEQAKELVANLKNFDHLVIEIAENFHYREDFLKAKEWIESGRIGDVFLIEMQARFWTDPSKGFASTPWRQDNQYRGGVVTDSGVHHAAGLRELAGEVEQLQAFTKSVHPVMGGLDTMTLNLRFRNGVLGNLIFAGAAKAPGGSFFEVAVYGSKGSIKLSDQKAVLNLSDDASEQTTQAEEFSPENQDGGYLAEFQNFYDAIRNKAPVVSTVEEAFRDMEIIMRAFDSAEARSVILL
ncbi:MAG TPA: Gfo/Idh/MocA family oxidoreductase [Chloroflexia bacterium]|nr:Gfo/Idh/MocA family oxidoreductase [Chloroflexia bacterium]